MSSDNTDPMRPEHGLDGAGAPESTAPGAAGPGTDPYAATVPGPDAATAGRGVDPQHATAAAIGAQAAQGAPVAAQPFSQHPEGASLVAPGTPTKPSQGGRWLQLGISLLVLLAMLGGLASWLSQRAKENSMMKVGNCITLTQKSGSKTTYEPNSIACDDYSKPGYMVVQKLDVGTCSDAYESLQYVDPKDDKKVQSAYCLMPNLKKDSCYSSQETVGQPIGLTPVACSEAKAKWKITDRLDGVDDKTKCPSSAGISFPLDPKRTYCVALPK